MPAFLVYGTPPFRTFCDRQGLHACGEIRAPEGHEVTREGDLVELKFTGDDGEARSLCAQEAIAAAQDGMYGLEWIPAKPD